MRVRNFAAMGDDKLLRMVEQFRTRGDAYERACKTHHGDPTPDFAALCRELEARALPQPDFPLPAPGAPTTVTWDMIGPMKPQNVRSLDDLATMPAGLVVEPKLDGWWLQILVMPDQSIRAWTRTGGRVEHRVPHLEPLFRRFPPGTRLVGELVSLGDQGSNHVQKVIRRTTLDPYDAGCLTLGVRCFDILSTGTVGVMHMAYRDRSTLLRQAVPYSPGVLSCVEPQPVDAADYLGDYEAALAAGAEGLILRDPEAPYVPDARGKGIWKVKAAATVDAVILDVSEGNGNFEGMAGGLLLGQRPVEGHGSSVHDVILDGVAYRPRARVSSGLDFAMRTDALMNPTGWIGRVVEIRHAGVQAGGWRHPTLLRFRDDLAPEEVVIHDH